MRGAGSRVLIVGLVAAGTLASACTSSAPEESEVMMIDVDRDSLVSCINSRGFDLLLDENGDITDEAGNYLTQEFEEREEYQQAMISCGREQGMFVFSDEQRAEWNREAIEFSDCMNELGYPVEPQFSAAAGALHPPDIVGDVTGNRSQDQIDADIITCSKRAGMETEMFEEGEIPGDGGVNPHANE